VNQLYGKNKNPRGLSKAFIYYWLHKSSEIIPYIHLGDTPDITETSCKHFSKYKKGVTKITHFFCFFSCEVWHFLLNNKLRLKIGWKALLKIMSNLKNIIRIAHSDVKGLPRSILSWSDYFYLISTSKGHSDRFLVCLVASIFFRCRKVI
jgi:hypothetical protein